MATLSDRTTRKLGDVSAPSFIKSSHQIVSPTWHIAGVALLFLGPGMLLATGFEWYYSDPHSNHEWGLLLSAAIVILLGTVIVGFTEPGDEIRPASVFSVVAWTWITSSVAGTLPMILGGMFTWSQWDSALFESISGFSCTGSTVLSDIEGNGKGVLMWRQITQWYGGMGMVVLAVTVLPFLGVGGLSLMTAEAPGVSADRLVPRVSETAQRLWGIYAGFSVIFTLILWLTPQMNFYDAFGHSMTTVATGGFSTNNTSLGHYDSVLIEGLFIAGMIFGGCSFALHYRAVRGDVKAYGRSADHVVFIVVIVLATIVVTLLNWWKGVAGFGASLRSGLFNVVSLSTSTGFGNATADPPTMGDFTALWTPGALIILFALMFVGGNTGSTSGGMKVWRIQVALSHMIRQLKLTRHPRAVFPVKLGRESVSTDVVNRVLGFVGLYIIISVIGTIIITAMGTDPITAGSGVVSAMGNMGPGLGEAGPTSNFLVYPRPARMLLALFMIVGRLEVFPMLMMFSALVGTGRRRGLHVPRPARTSSASH